MIRAFTKFVVQAILPLFVFFSFLHTVSAQHGNDVFDLRLKTEMNCDLNELTAVLQIRAQADTFKIGTSSVLLNYDPNVIKFNDYTSSNFNEDSPCFPGNFGGAWSSHSSSVSVSDSGGIFNLTLSIGAPQFSCPTVDTAWLDIGILQFEVTNINASPKIYFNLKNSTFNRNEPNNGTFAPEQGQLFPYDEILAIACACEAPTLMDDSFEVDCSQTSFEANILSNDITSNPTISLVSQPSSGTATINPNGILTYATTNPFCGVEEFTYKVCNDGKEDCCSEAKITLIYTDEIPPQLKGTAPADITISCEELLEAPNLLFTDNCSEITAVLNETTVDGNCPQHKIIQRTWTATDNCGNTTSISQRVELTDEIAPEFGQIPGDITVSCEQIPGPISMTATDNCQGTAVVEFTETAINNDCEKILMRTWIATDECGNSSTVSQEVTIIDDVAPTIECQEEVDVICNDLAVSRLEIDFPIVSDNCDDAEQLVITFTDETVSQNCQDFKTEQILRIWTVVDRCGNAKNCTQLINIIDDLAPVIDCPDDVTITCGQDISPSGLESMATAFDQCSGVDISFADLDVLPEDCFFEVKTIRRLWTAVDACGNVDSCIQEINVVGNPCPETITNEITTYQCDGDTVNLKALFDITTEQSYVITHLTGDTTLISEDAYTLPFSGCASGTHKFQLEVYDDRQCLLEQTYLTIITIPRIYADISFENDSCTVILNMECRESYEVTWLDNENEEGVGSQYFASEGKSGNVTFTIKYKGIELPVNLDLLCLQATFSAEFNCPPDCLPQGTLCDDANPLTINDIQDGNCNCFGTPCPELVEIDTVLNICAGTAIDFIEMFDLPTNIEFSGFGKNVSSAATNYVSIADCELQTDEGVISIKNEDGCLIENIFVKINTYPIPEGELYYPDTTYCKVALELDCENYFFANWEDDKGRTGTGNEYVGLDGESGTVTFYIHAFDSLSIDLGCYQTVYIFDYSCPINCPETEKEERITTLCNGETLKVLGYLNLTPNHQITVNGIELNEQGDYQFVNNGCEIEEQTFTVLVYDENQCIIREVTVQVTVLPSIIGDIAITSDEACKVNMVLECPEKYEVRWEDSEGRIGIGSEFIGAENTAGTVTFHVAYITENILFSEFNLDCLSGIYTADYSCISECPQKQIIQKELVVCANSTIDLFDEIMLSDSIQYVVDNDLVINGIYEINNPFGCEIGQKDFLIKGYDEKECLVEEIYIVVTVFPAMYADIRHEGEDGFCTPVLILECPDLYQVTWVTDQGETGTGNRYDANSGTNGTVTFYIEPIDSTLSNLVCGRDSFIADYSCPTICPEKEIKQIEITVCAESSINLLEQIILKSDIEYIFDNELIIDGVYQIGNPFGCEIGQKEFLVKGYDEQQCLVEEIYILVNVLPQIYGDIQYEGEGNFCKPTLVLECPDLYQVTWTDNQGVSGVGNVYDANSDTNGFVTFYIWPIDSTLIDRVCRVDSFQADYSCSTICPEKEIKQMEITVCAETSIDLFEQQILTTNNQYVFDNELIIDGVYQVGNPFGCEIGQKEFLVKGYDEQQCLVEEIYILVNVLPQIYGDIQYEEEGSFCKPTLVLECPDLYQVTWTDDQGVSGSGQVYEANAGTSGYVTFYVQPLDSTLIDRVCKLDAFQADYACANDCPPSFAEDRILTVCNGESINILEYLGLNEDTRFVLNDIELEDSGTYTFVNESCEIIPTSFGAIVYDENDCLKREIGVQVTIIPSVLAEINIINDLSCEVGLSMECPEKYVVRWEDSEGRNGEGTTFIGKENTAGTVTFYVTYKTDELLASEFELDCLESVFTATYSCLIDCPPGLAEDRLLTVCNGQAVNILEYLDGNLENRFSINGIELDESGIYTFVNESCEVKTTGFSVLTFDENDCLIKDIGVSVTIIPDIIGELATTTDILCDVSLRLECPEKYAVTWTDSEGRTGEGTSFIGVENTEGIVTFLVTYKTDDVLFSDLDCLENEFTASYSCVLDCPSSLFEDKVLTVCSGQAVNIVEYLDLNPDTRFVMDGIELDESGIYTFVNESCEVKMKDFGSKIFNENDCLLRDISVGVRIMPKIIGEVISTADVPCSSNLQLECPEKYEITWTDSEGRSGEGTSFTGLDNTAGTVTFHVTYKTDDIFFSEFNLGCLEEEFIADYSCIADCPAAELASIEIEGCHGDILNLKERLAFSDNLRYEFINNEFESIESISLINENTCSVREMDLTVSAIDENNCIRRLVTIHFNILPQIKGELISAATSCGLQLDLACTDLYFVTWVDSEGNTGEGTSYEADEGQQGTVKFFVEIKGLSEFDSLNNLCIGETFEGEYGCCKPIGTACDDGNEETFSDQEDGNCGCAGTKCTLENKGRVVDYSELDGCGLVIEMPDGTILEPAILPAGVELVAGQELIFTFIEISDVASICQAGKIVEIICLENTCPEAGTPCTDGNLATINDKQDGNCNCIGEAVPEVNSQVDLRFRPRLDCETNTYCVRLQIKAQQEDFSIGTSSIMVNYNPDALEFADYTSIQFDEKETCISGVSSPWDEHKVDGTSVAGKFCLTTTLNMVGQSCPEVKIGEWENIGTICFDIMDNSKTPELKFNTTNTHFNSSTPNDGTAEIPHGTFGEINSPEALTCFENEEGDEVDSPPSKLAIKALLQGPYQINRKQMSDQLRKKGLIPLTEPYTAMRTFMHVGNGGEEEITNEILKISGNDAIVDWVFLELRSALDSTATVMTKSALIQRDGDIVDVDGVSPVSFDITGNYYLCVKHRNHLGVMTATPINFESNVTTEIDFTDPNTPTYGEYAQLKFGDKMFLYGGNANPDKYVILAGGGLALPDRDMIFFEIFLSLWASDSNTPITYNSVLEGYLNSDINLDGKVKYQGPKNDIDAIIFFNVLFHPKNDQYRLNYAIIEQIP